MRLLQFACGVLLAAVLATTAGASGIGLFFDQHATTCDATIPLYTQSTWYLCALLYGDAAAGGMQGAEFRITGFPSGWFAATVTNPGWAIPSVVMGDPFGNGVELAFATCQPGPAVVLLTFNVFSTSPVHDVHLRTLARVPPSSPAFDCPSLVTCDPPVYTHICVYGATACINAPSSCCAFDAEPAQWGAVKALYR